MQRAGQPEAGRRLRPPAPRGPAAAWGLCLALAAAPLAVGVAPATAHAQVGDSAFVDTLDDEKLDGRDEEDSRLPLWARLGPPPESFDRVIQRRIYALGHEVAFLGGGLPQDPLYKGISVNLGYTYHFNHYLAWEVLQGTYLFNYGTSLKRQLRFFSSTGVGAPLKDLLATRTQIDWFLASRLVIKPFYGKEAFLDVGLVHMEVFVALGPAYVHTEGSLGSNAKLLGIADTASSSGLGLDVALGLRLWLAKHVSIRAELGELLYFQPAFKQALHASGGIAFTLGGEA